MISIVVVALVLLVIATVITTVIAMRRPLQALPDGIPAGNYEIVFWAPDEGLGRWGFTTEVAGSVAVGPADLRWRTWTPDALSDADFNTTGFTPTSPDDLTRADKYALRRDEDRLVLVPGVRRARWARLRGGTRPGDVYCKLSELQEDDEIIAWYVTDENGDEANFMLWFRIRNS